MAEDKKNKPIVSGSTPSSAPKAGAAGPVTQVSTSLPSPGSTAQASAPTSKPGKTAMVPVGKHARRSRNTVPPAKVATPPAPIVSAPVKAAPAPAAQAKPEPAAPSVKGPPPAPEPAHKPVAGPALTNQAPSQAPSPPPVGSPKPVAAPVVEKAPLPVEKGPAKAVPESPVVAKAETIQPAVEKTAPAAIEPAPTKDVPAKPATVSPPATVRTGSGTAHAMVPTPPKSRVPHAAAAAAPRKEHSLMTTATDFSEKFQSAFKDASEKAKAAFEKSQTAFGDAGEFAKGNVEAVVESSKILASGLQEMGKGYVAEGKTAIESLTAEIKELAAAKSPTEFFEKQTALMRKQFDAAVAASSKHSEAVLKLANDAFQPISNRVSLAVEKIKQTA